MSCHSAVDYTYVSPSARECTLLHEAAAFTRHVPEIGFSIPRGLYRVAWYAEDWGVRLLFGDVDLSGRRPVPMYLKAGRLTAARSDEERHRAERGLIQTIFHELSHVRGVLTLPLPLDIYETEARAEAFAARALEALAKHEARWERFVSTASTRR